MNTSKKPPKPKTRRGPGTMQFLTQEELKRLFAVIKKKRDKVQGINSGSLPFERLYLPK
jgi:hypothetical protein